MNNQCTKYLVSKLISKINIEEIRSMTNLVENMDIDMQN